MADFLVTQAAPLVRVNGLVKVFRSGPDEVTAADGIEFFASRGELVCILGASGSGKSTFINLLAGLDHADGGVIEVDGRRVDEMGEDARARLRMEAVGVVFQEHNLIAEFTAVENVALPLEVQGVSRQAAKDEAETRLHAVGLAEQCARFPHQLSGGQRQRVGIARALVGDRSVLLADEPTGALDTTNSRAIFVLLRELADAGMLVIVCTHDLDCTTYADRVLEMADGSLAPSTRFAGAA